MSTRSLIVAAYIVAVVALGAACVRAWRRSATESALDAANADTH